MFSVYWIFLILGTLSQMKCIIWINLTCMFPQKLTGRILEGNWCVYVVWKQWALFPRSCLWTHFIQQLFFFFFIIIWKLLNKHMYIKRRFCTASAKCWWGFSVVYIRVILPVISQVRIQHWVLQKGEAALLKSCRVFKKLFIEIRAGKTMIKSLLSAVTCMFYMFVSSSGR